MKLTKRKLDKFINGYVRALSLDEQEELLDKIESQWLPEIMEKFHDRLEKYYIKCPKCHKYFSKKRKLKTFWKEEIVENACVTMDPKYDFSDMFADVTCEVKYYICPLCANQIEMERVAIKVQNRHSRG